MKKLSSGSGAALRRTARLLRPYSALAVLSFLLAAGGVVCALYIPILIGRALDLIIAKGEVNISAVTPLLLRVLVFAAASALCRWGAGAINNRVCCETVRSLRLRAMKKLQKLPLSYLDSHPLGDTLGRVITDSEALADGLLLGFSQLFSGIVTIICTLAFMFRVDWKLALLAAVLTPASLFTARFIARRTHAMFTKQAAIRGEQTAFIDETVSGQKVVRAFGREEADMAAFREINGRLTKATVRAVFFSSLTNPVTRFINCLIYAAVALAGALFVTGSAGAGLTVGGLTAFLSYANQYTKPFNEISGVVTELQNSLVCAARVYELLDEPGEEEPDGEPQMPPAKGEAALKEIDFSYDKSKTLIKDLSLSVAPGNRVAIVGPTGCGKTTLINLLMRFYEPDGGSIEIDGTDVLAYTRASLRANFGMVLQDTWIKEATVRENIALGKPDATDAEIYAAARDSHADAFIRRLPRGYDTVISDSGGLSQGQRQLLCIARVMLRLPPMLILDEATSSIDTRTELKIQDAFLRMMRGRTSFIVAHRLSTVRDADLILVMRDGRVIEQGRHADLLAKGGFYAKLYNSQFE
ncbi:MAG: ABC transporter ATP-binding protein [Clostridia bacterium]|nr:ABC transporter ATP-binding protein [Clostridia bacterium]